MPHIYTLQSKATRQVYVGSTQDLETRQRLHKSKLKHGIHRCKKLQEHHDQHGYGDLVLKHLGWSEGDDYELINLVHDVAPEMLFNTVLDPEAHIARIQKSAKCLINRVSPEANEKRRQTMLKKWAAADRVEWGRKIAAGMKANTEPSRDRSRKA